MKDYTAPRNTNRTIPYYSQIDYILCRSNYKKLLVNARSYGGTHIRSDHKIVIAKFDFQDSYLVYPMKKPQRHFDCTTLVSDPDAKLNYRNTLDQILSDTPVDTNPDAEMNNLFQGVSKAAEQSIGYLPRKRHKNFSNDPDIREMSDNKKSLQALLNHSNKPEDRTLVRSQINRLQNNIQKRLKTIQEKQADVLAQEINSTDNARACFAATRQLAGIKRAPIISVHDKNSNFIGTDAGKAATLKNHFENKFTSNSTVQPIATFADTLSPLMVPVTAYEVKAAAEALKNGRATGPDKIPSELIKYSNNTVFERYANCLNAAFETSTVINSIGKGNITPLQKPK